MDEPKRFFRFVLPGLGVLLELLFFLWLLAPAEVTCWLLRYRSELSGAGAMLAAFVSSGAIGFVLANVYHFFAWTVLRGRFSVNHRRLILDACMRGCLKLRLLKSGKNVRVHVKGVHLSYLESWRIATAIWHARIGLSQRLQGANARTDTLTSIVHGIGTLTVGTICAALFALWVTSKVHPVTVSLPQWICEQPGRFWIASVALGVSQASAFWVAVRHAERVIDMILFEELLAERPVEWHIP